MYYLQCKCGARPAVRLTQAGSSIECPDCGAVLDVPSSSDLKRMAGDRSPYLGTVERIAAAVKEGRPPFDGTCQQCGQRPASVEILIEFRFLVKREVSDREGLQPGLTGTGPGLVLAVGAAREFWQSLRFPLLFCAGCHRDFRRRRMRSALVTFVTRSTEALVLLPLLLMVVFLAVFMPILCVPAVILVIVMALRYRIRKKVNPFVLATLQKVPLVGEAIFAEDEYRIDTDPARPYSGRGAT